MALFLRQLAGEWTKLFATPRAGLGFFAVLAGQLVLALAYKLPGPRAMVLADAGRFHVAAGDLFSGLTSAAFLLANSTSIVAAFFVALVGAESIAQEVDQGTLRMILIRPVSRARIFALKLLVISAYTVLLGLFAGASALAVGVVFEGRGPLIFIVVAERVVGTFDVHEGLQRYALACALVPFSLFTAMLLGLCFSCMRMKPAAAAALALTLLLGELSLRRIPGTEGVRRYSIAYRGVVWMKAFNNTLPVGLILREAKIIGAIDLVLIGAAWAGFRRRELKP